LRQDDAIRRRILLFDERKRASSESVGQITIRRFRAASRPESRVLVPVFPNRPIAKAGPRQIFGAQRPAPRKEGPVSGGTPRLRHRLADDGSIRRVAAGEQAGELRCWIRRGDKRRFELRAFVRETIQVRRLEERMSCVSGFIPPETVHHNEADIGSATGLALGVGWLSPQIEQSATRGNRRSVRSLARCVRKQALSPAHPLFRSRFHTVNGGPKSIIANGGKDRTRASRNIFQDTQEISLRKSLQTSSTRELQAFRDVPKVVLGRDCAIRPMRSQSGRLSQLMVHCDDSADEGG
jgi:hypothetical protein